MSLSTLASADMDALLASDWGETATVAGVDVPAIYESDTGMVDDVDTAVPSLLVRDTVVVSTGDSVLYGGNGYTVVRIEHPWRDVKRLYLSEDARFEV